MSFINGTNAISVGTNSTIIFSGGNPFALTSGGQGGGGLMQKSLLCNLEIGINSTNTLTTLAIQFQDNVNGTFYTAISGSDWATPTNNALIRLLIPATPLATTNKTHIKFNCGGVYAVQAVATATNGTSMVYGLGSFTQNII